MAAATVLITKRKMLRIMLIAAKKQIFDYDVK
jgi:hypothetical protein